MALLIFVFLGGALYLYTASGGVSGAIGAGDTNLVRTDIMILPDISPIDQGGEYSQGYDTSFLRASREWGIPFALLKAHAIAESSLNSSAFRQEPKGKASYGLMQLLWWKNSNRFNVYGVSDDRIGDGSLLYDPDINVNIAAQLIKDNLRACRGNLRDTVNMYNTGRTEIAHPAPFGYVNKVLEYYSRIIGKDVSLV